ncbi:DUF3606 domain-containing protein [Paraburkholderia dioscoreae]|uniref:DUF3606 domain-containing protein n=1 Tax=Paraburkholderia dioscoreae TaxID=2604047 RepID=A0A5Q4YU28_9BURK|nr:DUF3606 domain-containing protein [Paraburkholderia dioscoreae]VVD29863.1 conserved protein of unknown function [Paraburkholderia dioscoreae]
MADNLKIREPQDGKQVNVHEPWELEYWSNKFGVSKEALKRAVAQVGTHVDAVRRHLGKN